MADPTAPDAGRAPEVGEGRALDAGADPGPAPPWWRPVRRFGHLRATLAPAGLYPLGVLFGLNLVDEFDRVGFAALLPEIRDTFGLSDDAAISIAALATAFSILMAVPVGYLADRTNRVRLAQAAGLVWVTASVFTGLAPVLAVLVIARFVSGVGRVVNEPVHPSLLGDYYGAPQLPLVFGIHRFANIIGFLAGPLAGALAALLGDWRLTFVILAVPTIPLLLLTLSLREPTRGGTIDLEAALADEARAERVPMGEAFRRLRAVQSLKRTWVAAFFFGSGVLPFNAVLSIFFEEVYGMGPVGRGFVQALFGVGGGIGLLYGTRVARRLVGADRPERLPMVVGLMIVQFAVAAFLMGVVPTMTASAALVLVLAIGAQGFLPAYLTMVSLVSAPRLRSQAYAYSLLFYALGGVVLSRVATSVGEAHGDRWTVVLLSLFVAAGGYTATTVHRFVRRDMAEAAKSVGARAEAETGTLLVVRGLEVAYDQVQVLFGVDFDVHEGEIVALLGTNGAGKSTLMKAISGVVDPIGGAAFFDGRDITHADPNTTASLGIVLVPGGRGIFPGLSVSDNLRAAGWLYRSDPEYRRQAVDKVLEYFPILRERWDLPAGNLSGGEQQMLSLGKAFIARPKLLLIDELSLGLAPTVVESLLGIVRAIHANGTTVVLVEQSVNTALKVAERAVFMEKGEVRFAGRTADLLSRPDILRAVFLEGAAAAAGEQESHTAEAARARRTSAAVVREERARRRQLEHADVVLRTEGLTKRYGGITAVWDVDLVLRDHEILGLIGPNGAGKTTIFDLISGFQALDAGRIELLGDDITKWPAHKRAGAGLGRTFQDARLWPSLTVSEALATAFERYVRIRATVPAFFGIASVAESEAQVRASAEELVGLLGLGAFRDKFVSELSTGTRRMVEIAAMLAHRPRVLLLDEPSSGIAQRETEALGEFLREVRQFMGCSLLVIEHDMPLITRLADRIVALEQGTVLTDGSPAEVIRHPRVVEAYLGSMAEELELAQGNGKSPSSSRRARRPRPRAART